MNTKKLPDRLQLIGNLRKRIKAKQQRLRILRSENRRVEGEQAHKIKLDQIQLRALQRNV